MIDAHFEGSFDGVRRFSATLTTIEDFVGPLMVAWAKVLVEDNRKGVLAGRDKNDTVVMKTHYRTSFVQAGYDRPTYVKGVVNPAGDRSWLVNIRGNMDSPGYKGGSSHNLKTSEYKKMSGPPLAPRGMASRIISNYVVSPIFETGGRYGVEGGWNDVTGRNGYPFLYAHFNGTGLHKGGNYATFMQSRQFKKLNNSGKGFGRGRNLPRRDMNGLRKWGRDRARRDLKLWIEDLMETFQNKYFNQTGHTPEFVPYPVPRRRRR
jgi:hypothetical protein